LISSLKGFRDGHRRDLRRSKFINVKQSARKMKVNSPDGRVGRLKKESCCLVLVTHVCDP
jgi:hypothetical protein